MSMWKSKVDALILLAEDQAGKPEGDLARQKLRLILDKYPEARQYAPVKQFMMGDLARMRRAGISTDGSWTGRDLAEALALMAADYAQRLASSHHPLGGYIAVGCDPETVRQIRQQLHKQERERGEG